MEVNCPSCGQKHETDDYPGAVEIPCACGYSVFIDDPNNQNLSPESLDPAEPFLNSPPLSFESQDNSLLERQKNLDEKSEPIYSNNMTSPDNLPSAMPYDRFELGNKLLQDLEDMEDEAKLGGTLESDSDQNDPGEFQHQILGRIQNASVGRFLGNSFSLEIINLNDDKELELLGLIEKFLVGQSWINEEVQRKKLDLKKMLSDRIFSEIPEALAVEIYLRSFELGALCKFESTTQEPIDP